MLQFVDEVYPVETNILIFRVDEKIGDKTVLQKLSEKDIKSVSFGKNLVRIVTHLDVTPEMVDSGTLYPNFNS